MSENTHTPEPWNIAKHNKSIIKCYQGEQTPHGTTPYFAGGGALESEREANARRIVACVNACAGIKTDDLESFGQGEFSPNPSWERQRELRKQRDELLAALERIAAGPGSNRLSTAIEWAKDAIASVKGESK